MGAAGSGGMLSAAAALALLAGMASVSVPVAAQSAELVSNLNQVFTTFSPSTSRSAQAFTTGDDEAGYVLTSVRIGSNFTNRSYSAALYTANASGHPDTEVAALTAPASFAELAEEFTAPADTFLRANTTYAIVVSSLRGVALTGSNAEDTGAASGWSIADAYSTTIASSWVTTNSGNAMLLAIDGEERTNNPATGTVSISGAGRVGQELTASVSGVADDDGLSSSVTYAYQWVRVEGETETDISGATSSTYMPVAADSAKRIKVRVSFTDDVGFSERLESAAVLIRGANPASCPANTFAGRTEVWSATLTVGAAKRVGTETVALYGYTVGGLVYPSAGSLSARTFDIGTNSHTVEEFVHNVGGVTDGRLNLNLSATLTRGEAANLRLHICGETYELSDATETARTQIYQWPTAGLDWSSVTTRAVALSMRPNAPVFPDATLARSIAENTAANTNVGAAIPAATDADTGDTLTYSIEGTDAGSFDFNTTTRQITTKTGVTYDFEAKPSYAVTIKVEDGNGGSDTVAVTITLRDRLDVGARSTAPGVVAVEWDSPAFRKEVCPASRYDLVYQPRRISPQGSYYAAHERIFSASTTRVELTGLFPDHEYRVKVREHVGPECRAFGGPLDWVRTSVRTQGHEAAPSVPRVSLVIPDPVGDFNTPGLGRRAVVEGAPATVRVLIDLPGAEYFTEDFDGVGVTLEYTWSEGIPKSGTTSQRELFVPRQGAQRHGKRWYSDYEVAIPEGAWRHGPLKVEMTDVYVTRGGESPSNVTGRTEVSFEVCDQGVEECVLSSQHSGEPEPSGPLTVEFVDLPSTHDGESDIVFELRFNQDLATDFSYTTLQNGALQVTNGTIERVERFVKTGAQRNRRWHITVSPGTAEQSVFITLAPTFDCAAAGAICSAAGQSLSVGLAASLLAQPDGAETQGAELTVAYTTDPPAEHDGKTPFTFAFSFSENLHGEYSYRTMRDHSLDIRQGSGTPAPKLTPHVKRKTPGGGNNQDWVVTVRPDGYGDVTVRLPATADCAAPGAICTADGKKLSNTVSATVPGPAALSVADARADENADAAVEFAVTLSRAAPGRVTVDYATSDGTATAGADYTATSGTLTFTPGETAKTVSVPVLDDVHDEGEERFALRLSNAAGARIADGEATGIIENSDHMPKAWIARFGRTVTGQVLEAVEARLTGARTAGAEAMLAGQALPSWRAGADPGSEAGAGGARERTSLAGNRDAADTLRDWMTRAGAGASGGVFGAGGGPEARARALTGRDLVTGTSFALTGGTAEGGHAALWGRVSVAGFDGREGDLALDGEVTTGLLGADWASDPGSGSGAGRWTAGLALGHSTGAGGYREGDCTEGNCGGKVEASLTGVYPYAGLRLTDRLSAWAAAGYGSGELRLMPDRSKAMTADLTMSMGAAGMRSEVLKPENGAGLALAVKGDARIARTSSSKAKAGGMEAAEAEVWLLRTGFEGSRRFALGEGGGGASVTPSFELGLRLDGGDAERGFGADMGGGLAFADAKRGLRFELKGRGLVAHRASGFREWGASAAFGWDPRPSTERGLALSLTQSWGASPSGGMDALLSRETLAGLAANDPGSGAGEGRFEAASRLQGELGYGIALFGGGFTGTPNIGFGLSNGGARDYRLGWRLTSAVPGDPGFEVNLDATRKEAANENAGHGVMLRGTVRW